MDSKGDHEIIILYPPSQDFKIMMMGLFNPSPTYHLKLLDAAPAIIHLMMCLAGRPGIVFGPLGVNASKQWLPINSL